MSTWQAAGSPAPQPVAGKPGLRQRVFGWKSMLAVGIAGLVIGGASGAGITAAVRDGDAGRPDFGPGQGQFPGGGSGQQPPAQEGEDGTGSDGLSQQGTGGEGFTQEYGESERSGPTT